MNPSLIQRHTDPQGRDIPAVVIENARIVSYGSQFAMGTKVFLKQGKIWEVSATAGEGVKGAVRVDASGTTLSPGFIDLHIHGTHESLVDEGFSALESLSAILPKYGVTSFLPTVLPTRKEEHLRRIRDLSRATSKGSNILGIFAEGPFLTIPGSLCISPNQTSDKDWVSSFQDAASPYSVVFAISPEFPGIEALYPLMTAQGMPMFMTHTRASVAATQVAIAHGAQHATHFYDVFPFPDETEAGVRPCGAVEAILADPSVSVDFILDGVHVDPIAVKMALQSKELEKVCLITDANRGAGLSPGKIYSFGDQSVSFTGSGAPARLSPDHPLYPGALAGSGLTMNMAVHNAVQLLNLELAEAIAMASLSPAKVLGLSGRKGKVREGYDADLVLLEINTLKPLRTWVGGVDVFNYSKTANT